MSTKKISMIVIMVIIAGLVVLTGCKKEQPAANTAAPRENAPAVAQPADANAAQPAAPAAETEQTMCPVMNEKINKDIFVEYKGKKVYFCCLECKAEFDKDPEKYVASLPQFKQ